MVDCNEHQLTLEITTEAQALQAQRKLDALVIGGWEILEMDVLETTDPDSGQRRRFRVIRVCGGEIQQA